MIKNPILSLLCVFAACFGGHVAHGQNDVEQLKQDLESAAEKCMEAQNLPGMAVVVVKDGKTIYKQGFGMANVAEGLKVDADRTLFRIGSVSKALTLLTLTRQIDLERIKLSDDVSKYVDGISNGERFADPVTVEHLLTHTGGFDQIGGRDRQIYDVQSSLADRQNARPSLAQYLSDDHLRRVNAPGKYFRYDTYGSSLAGAIIEKLTGLPFAEAMKQELFKPLGMTRSFVEADPAAMRDLALGYGFVGGQFVQQPYEVFVTTPASSIDATPADMGRLMEALTSDGANATGRLFSIETNAKVLASQFRCHPEFVGVTHGMFEWWTSRDQEIEHRVRAVGHGGTMNGYTTFLQILPEHNVGLFVVANRAREAGGGEVDFVSIVRSLVEHLPNVAKQEPLEVPRRQTETDLTEFTGNYFYGVFCHEPTNRDRSQGAWPRPRPTVVTQQDGVLRIRDDEFVPRGNDVFVQANGQRMVFFGRNDSGVVSHFTYSTSADTFEKFDE